MIISLCALNFCVKVDFEVNAVYDTENGVREFSDSNSVTVQDLYHTMPLFTPGAHYTFSITAYTNEGPGPTVSVNNTLDNGRKGEGFMYVQCMAFICYSVGNK